MWTTFLWYNAYMEPPIVQISDPLLSDLEEISNQRGMPVNDLVLETLRRYVAIERFRSLHKRAIPSAESQGIQTDQDIFRIMS